MEPVLGVEYAICKTLLISMDYPNVCTLAGLTHVNRELESNRTTLPPNMYVLYGVVLRNFQPFLAVDRNTLLGRGAQPVFGWPGASGFTGDGL